MTDCQTIEKFCQFAGARDLVVVDWTHDCAEKWAAGEQRAAGECFRPTVPNGFQYRVSIPSAAPTGQSGAAEPLFKGTLGKKNDFETVGATYPDGSLLLTAEVANGSSIARAISVSVWEGVTDAEVTGLPADITIDGDATQSGSGEEKTWAYAASAVLATYRLRNRVTFSPDGKIGVAKVDVEIE